MIHRMIGKKYWIMVAVAVCTFVALSPSVVSAETAEESLKKQLVQSLSEQLKSLQSQLAEMKGVKVSSSTPEITVNQTKTSASFKKLRNETGEDEMGEGKYMMQVAITAGKSELYIPVSIATGRKSNGLIYQVEGTERAQSSATVTCSGENSVIVTSGTISYCKVPAGKMVSFKVLVTITGEQQEEYWVTLGRVNYKLNPNDVRYKKFLTDIRTKKLRFN